MNIILLDISGNISIAGGAEKVLCDMANELVNRGHNISILSFYEGDKLPFYHLNYKVNFINPGTNYKIPKFFCKLKTCMIFDKAKRNYRRDYFICEKIGHVIKHIIDKLNVDIIIAFNKPSGFLVKDVLKRSEPLIVSFHSTPDVFLKGAKEVLLNKFLNDCDCVTVLLPEYIEILKKYVNPRKVICLPNSVPQYKIDYYNTKMKVIANVARVDKHAKRQHLLINAFALVSEKFRDWNVEIWGDYSRDRKYHDYLLNLINSHGLDDRVKLCGTSDKIEDIYMYSSVFAFPSSHEGFSLALTEAMSAGLPCVGYNSAPGVNSLIKNGHNGYLVEDGIEPFAKALEKLMRNEELRKEMGRNAKKDMEQYSPKIIWDKWEKLIFEVVNNKIAK